MSHVFCTSGPDGYAADMAIADRQNAWPGRLYLAPLLLLRPVYLNAGPPKSTPPPARSHLFTPLTCSPVFAENFQIGPFNRRVKNGRWQRIKSGPRHWLFEGWDWICTVCPLTEVKDDRLTQPWRCEEFAATGCKVYATARKDSAMEGFSHEIERVIHSSNQELRRNLNIC